MLYTERMKLNKDGVLTIPGKVGIGTPYPEAKLDIGGLSGGHTPVISNSFRVDAGELGAIAEDELALGNLGFTSNLNTTSLGVRALRTANGNDWTTTALVLEMDVDTTKRASDAFITLGANDNVGIGKTDPGYALDVNGKANATELCISGDCRTKWPTSSNTKIISGTTNAPSYACSGGANYAIYTASFPAGSFTSTPAITITAVGVTVAGAIPVASIVSGSITNTGFQFYWSTNDYGRNCGAGSIHWIAIGQ
jgi:hypothetical protein